MLSFPTNPTTGQQYTDGNGKVWKYDSVKWNISNTPGIKQFFGTKISLANDVFLNDTLSTIPWDTEEFDTSGFFNASAATIIRIPTTGYYRLHLSIYTGQEGNGASYTIELKRNSSTLIQESMAAYQSGIYDVTTLLNSGDEIILYASEDNNIGRLVEGTFVEVQLVGYTFGSSLIPGFEFSGIKAELQNQLSVSSTETAIEWLTSDIVFNTNADSAGNVYWDNGEPSKFTVSTAGYYRLRAFILTGINGSSDSYTINVKKNNTTDIETITLGANESAELDETYYLELNDYIEITYSNTENLGTIEADNTFFELTRLGV
jgi:hypothetical protein